VEVRKAEVLDAIVRHAREAAPDECCGLLLGRAGAILEAMRARNVADEPATRFLIDPAAHFTARRMARERGVEVVGFYHSHPASPAEPSARDIAEFQYPGHLYAIVGLDAGCADVRLFRFEDGNFHRVSFVTVG
jgi:proteasome lid subunit RPN8/RPN11